MRLKVSPKAALIAIDRLIYQGFDLQREYGYWLKSSSAVGLTKEGKEKLEKWHSKAIETLQKVFLDFAPVYFFFKAIDDQDDYEKRDLYSFSLMDGTDPREYAKILNGGLQILGEYYQRLSDQVYTPLFYAADKAQICFFASVCALQPDSNEDTLCRYMFTHHSFNEWVEMEDIFARSFGGNKDEYDKKDRAKIENAAEGVNKKAKDAFDFPVFRQKKTLVSLHLPSRFLREAERKISL